tara:strand:+ start:16586 stop:16780 length:195 start_codon:yes stop_codon:yes gene_type:complete
VVSLYGVCFLGCCEVHPPAKVVISGKKSRLKNSVVTANDIAILKLDKKMNRINPNSKGFHYKEE